MKTEQGSQTIEQRGSKAPFFLWRDLKDGEKDICYRLVHRGGSMLGWNKRSFNAAHVKLSRVEDLVKVGVLRKVSLFQLAQELVDDEFSRQQKEEFDEMGDFLALTNGEDRDFFRSFDQAVEMIEKGNPSDFSEERYQIARKDFYDFIELLFRGD